MEQQSATKRGIGRGIVRAVLACVGVALLTPVAHALPRYGPIEIAGNVSALNLIRMTSIDKYALVMQRNTLKLRVDYGFLTGGKLVDRVNVPYIDRAKLFLLYRGAYDSVYDYTPGFNQNDIYGAPIGQTLSSLPSHTRDSYKFQNQLREAYIDLNLADIPLSLRLGKQQIVWGETDNFRLLDRVNALDLRWHLQQESWDELRQTYWMLKGLYDLDRVGPFSNAFLEFYWNPGDWYPARKSFLPRPWSGPVLDPFAKPVLGDRNLFQLTGTNALYANTQLFYQGDYSRTPGDNSQAGMRVSAVTPPFWFFTGGIQFTLNYFYQRWNGGDDGTNAAVYRGLTQLTRTQLRQLMRDQKQLPIEAYMPYVHTFGLSLNYSEEEHTQTVYRMETIYELGVPFNDLSKHFDTGSLAAPFANDVFGATRRDMWKGMIAFDRPTWIRPVNRKSTVLILGQFFWHYLVHNPQLIECADAAAGACAPGLTYLQGFTGNYSTSGAGSGTAYHDRVRSWEMLTTLAATTFYQGGKVVPFLVYVLDPMNKYNQEVIAKLDYYLTNDLILGLAQRYFINTTSYPVFETFGVGGTNRGRSETGIQVTYQF